MIDHELELGRLNRLRSQLVAAGCDGGVFYDPINIRYATGTSNMQVYSLRNPCRYVFVPAEGSVVLFDFKGCAHLSAEHPAVDEVREATSWYHFVTGSRTSEYAEIWADEIAALAGASRSRGRRIAIDRLDPYGFQALMKRGVEIVDGQEVANRAKVIKTDSELRLMRSAVEACESAIGVMAEHCEPGVTERELWSSLHAENIGSGGEWLETRLLTSGPRTNPWYQECSDRAIENGDLVAFDTDLVGIGGYSVDISRTWLAGDRSASDAQRQMHSAALAQITENVQLMQPGVSFREVSAKAHKPPGSLHSPTNACVAHGVGLCNEFPLILNSDHADGGYDGVIEVGMTLCVESLIAPENGREAVKLEEQIVVTKNGPDFLSAYPYDPKLAG